MEILWFKILAIIIIVISGLGGGLLPMRIGVSKLADRLLPLGNAFSGGIFLGAGLIHLLPDAKENFGRFAGDIDFPLVFLVCGCGFLLVFFLEKVLLRGEDVGAMSGGRSVYPFVLTLVLSVHSLIAGAALGLEKTLISSVVLFIAIIAHKSSAAFALGSSLSSARTPSARFIMVIIFFSCMTPLGIVIGTAFSGLLTSNTAAGVEAVFDALAAGTFLYVSIIDIIEESFIRREERWLKFTLLSAAFYFMALIAVWM